MKALSAAQARAIVIERAGDCCEVGYPGVCLGRRASLHHRRKRSKGGLWAASNLLAVCGDGTRGCHGWIEAHPAIARTCGWWIFTGDGEPSAVPVVLHANAMSKRWLLSDTGSVTELAARPPVVLGPAH